MSYHPQLVPREFKTIANLTLNAYNLPPPDNSNNAVNVLCVLLEVFK